MPEVFPVNVKGEIQFLSRAEIRESMPKPKKTEILKRLVAFLGRTADDIEDARFDGISHSAGPIPSAEYAAVEAEIQELAKKLPPISSR